MSIAVSCRHVNQTHGPCEWFRLKENGDKGDRRAYVRGYNIALRLREVPKLPCATRICGCTMLLYWPRGGQFRASGQLIGLTSKRLSLPLAAPSSGHFFVMLSHACGCCTSALNSERTLTRRFRRCDRTGSCSSNWPICVGIRCCAGQVFAFREGGVVAVGSSATIIFATIQRSSDEDGHKTRDDKGPIARGIGGEQAIPADCGAQSIASCARRHQPTQPY